MHSDFWGWSQRGTPRKHIALHSQQYISVQEHTTSNKVLPHNILVPIKSTFIKAFNAKYLKRCAGLNIKVVNKTPYFVESTEKAIEQARD